MIRLDPTTLLTVSFATTFLVGTLFLLSWRQAPGSRPLALWGAAHLAGALASGGFALRGRIPDLLSIGLANAMMLSAFGLIWSGVRAFEGRPVGAPRTLAGAVVWTALCLVPAFYGTIAARIVLASLVAGLYCAAAAADLWRGRAERLASRLPAVALLALHGGFYLLRIPATLFAPPQDGANALTSMWVATLCFAAMLFSIASAFTFTALVKERAEREQRIAAHTDPLTGLANRRAFFEGARRILTGGRQVALLMFDIDRFKGVNDTYGHAVGDAVIVGFCATAAALLPPDALMGRIGGEEFACLLPDVSPAVALRQAECLRRTFTQLYVPELPDLQLSVSVGIASDRDARAIDDLMSRADAALYTAKGKGRDRVELAPIDRPRAA